MNSPVILHIDMNSYFASVEQQANPFLRGRAVGVCAYLSENGCILASSMEAKTHGVKTGMRVREARHLWPETVFLQNDPPKYRSVTQAVFNILAQYSDRIEPYSIDEAFLELTGYAKNLEEGLRIGREINRRIKSEVGEWLRSSAGVAPTRFLAKLASDTGAKDSVTILPPTSVPQYLHALDLEDIWGIARATRVRLAKLGIQTPLQFRDAAPAPILSALGKYGYYLWASLNGIELYGPKRTELHRAQNLSANSPHPSGAKPRSEDHSLPFPSSWSSATGAKSIGHSYCLPKKTKDKSYLAAILMKLCEKTGRRLRAHLFEARSLSVSWGYAQGGVDGAHRRLPAPLWDSWEIFTSAYRPLAACALTDRVSFLAVSVTHFSPPSPQPSLFPSEDHSQQKKRSLTRALDALNNKWGDYTVIRGAMFGTYDNAPDRIGYRKSLSAPQVANDLTAHPLV